MSFAIVRNIYCLIILFSLLINPPTMLLPIDPLLKLLFLSLYIFQTASSVSPVSFIPPALLVHPFHFSPRCSFPLLFFF